VKARIKDAFLFIVALTYMKVGTLPSPKIWHFKKWNSQG